MKQRAKDSTSYPIVFLMLDAADRVTGKTGLSPTVTISKNGGSFGAASGAVTEISSGWYALAGNAGDRDTLGTMAIHAAATGAVPIDDAYEITTIDYFAAQDKTGMGLADSAITSAKFAAGAITAAAFASGALDAVWSTAARTLTSFGTLAADIWAVATSGLTGAGTIGKRLVDYLTGDIFARLGAPAGASVSSDIAAVKSDTAAILVDTGTTLDGAISTIDTVVDAIKTKTDYLPSATAGAAGGVFIAGSNAATTANITGNITGNLSGSVGSVTGAVGSVTGAVASVTAAVTVGTNNDKTGYALSSAGVQAIWDALSSALTTTGSIGKRLVDYLTGDIFARLGSPSGASMSADIAAVKAETALIVEDTGTTLPASVAALPTDSDVQVAAAAALTAYDPPTKAELDAAVSPLATASALSTVAGYIDTEVAAIKAKTDNLPADPASNTVVNTRLAAASYTAPDNASITAILEDTGTTIPASITALPGLILENPSYPILTDSAGRVTAANLGTGAVSTTITTLDTTGLTRIANTRVWLTADAAGTTELDIFDDTDTLGQVTFLLDPGTYYVWRSNPLYSFDNPETLVVS